MNKKVMVLVAALCLAAAGVAFALPAEGVAGYQALADGSQTSLRLGHERQLVTGPAHGDFYEAARLGQMFTVKTASAGTSFTTAGTSPLAAAGIAWLAIYNPPCSSSPCAILEIDSVTIVGISGTPGVGGQIYNLGCGQAITAAQNATPVSSLNPTSSGLALGFTQTALTGSTALKEIGVSSYAPFAGAMAATTPGLTVTDNINGRFVVGPGCVFAIQTTAAGTTHVAAGSITYRQTIQ